MDNTMGVCARGWGYFAKFSVAAFSMPKRIGPNHIKGFAKFRGQKRLKSMKMWAKCIENQDEN